MGAGLHLYKMTCWRSNDGTWHVNDVSNLTGKSAKWYAPMRILDLSVEDYIRLLVDKFHAKQLSYYKPTDYLGFCFDTEIQAKTFCNYVNKIARQKQWWCK